VDKSQYFREPQWHNLTVFFDPPIKNLRSKPELKERGAESEVRKELEEHWGRQKQRLVGGNMVLLRHVNYWGCRSVKKNRVFGLEARRRPFRGEAHKDRLTESPDIRIWGVLL